MGKRQRQNLTKHRQSLQEQLDDPQSHGVRVNPRAQKQKRQRDEDDDELMSAKMSSRILKEARAQQQDLDLEDWEEGGGAGQPGTSGRGETAAGGGGGRSQAAAQLLSSGALSAALQRLADSDDEGDEDGGLSEDGSVWAPGDEEEAGGGVTAEEEAALAAFMAPGADAYQQRSLGDTILDRIRQQQQEAGLAVLPESGAEAPVPEGLDERVVAVYRDVGALLSRYTTGKVPKAFKIIPSLVNWEEVLYLTAPEAWSPHAVAAATKIFVSNLNARLAQRFLALVLLPRVRADIREHRRLHFALFQALKKATYKPGAFFKGLLLPLCASRTCSLREAVILSSCLKRASLPALHSAAALLRLAQMEYCGTTSFFMRVLLDKKYALPFRVVDALAAHFVRFADDERRMPVVWHQCLLCFVQRYKHELQAEDRQALEALAAAQHHYQVSPEVLRELAVGVARDQRGSGSGPQAMDVAAPAGPGGALFGGRPAVGHHVVEDARHLAPLPAALMEAEPY